MSTLQLFETVGSQRDLFTFCLPKLPQVLPCIAAAMNFKLAEGKQTLEKAYPKFWEKSTIYIPTLASYTVIN